MTRDDFSAFRNCWNAVADATGAQHMSDAGITLVFNALAKYTLEDVRRAILAHLVSDRGHFMPRAADIVRQIEGTSEERGALAWRYFLDKIFHYGLYMSVRFPNPAYHFVIDRLGGWEYVCEYYGNMKERELDYHRREFLALYAAGEKSASWSNVQPYMPGFFERDNHMKGLDKAIPDPVDVETGRKISRKALCAPSARLAFSAHNEYGEVMRKYAEKYERMYDNDKKQNK